MGPHELRPDLDSLPVSVISWHMPRCSLRRPCLTAMRPDVARRKEMFHEPNTSCTRGLALLSCLMLTTLHALDNSEKVKIKGLITGRTGDALIVKTAPMIQKCKSPRA